ncbi:unnamed protein product [Citrullus colocynthis]|uniref:Uncharacterized protein n=1 Tax=Citrullus colocynthis TaxID=252529 RepID=A0ABP0YYP9_9ROSI
MLSQYNSCEISDVFYPCRNSLAALTGPEPPPTAAWWIDHNLSQNYSVSHFNVFSAQNDGSELCFAK